MVLQAMTPVCKREKTSVILFYCSCFFAFLASSNFFSLQGYLILLSSLLLIASECARGLPHNRFDLAILFLFGLSYIACTFITSRMTGDGGVWGTRFFVYFLLSPLSVFITGENSVYSNDRRPLIYLTFFSVGFFTSALLTVQSTFIYQGFQLGMGNPLIPGFSNPHLSSRTGLSLVLLPVCGLSFFYIQKFLYKKKRFWYEWVLLFSCIAVVLFSVYCSNKIGNRSFLFSFIIALWVICFLKVYKTKHLAIKVVFYSGSILLVIGSLFLLLGFVPKFLLSIPVFQRFANLGSNSQRFKLYIQFFSTFYKNPLGGTFLYIDDRYIHNFILDIYNFAGVVPFLCFNFLLLKSVIVYLKTRSVFRECIDMNFDAAFHCALCMFSIGLFEPVFQANEATFLYFGLFFGISCATYRKRFIGNTKYKI